MTPPDVMFLNTETTITHENGFVNVILKIFLLFCQAFFNRFLEVFLFFLKYSRKRAKSQANRGL